MQTPDIGNLKIMLAMASQQAAEAVKDVLMRQRVARVFNAANNREAVAELQDRSFNLIIIEQDFPDLGGIDFCRFLRLTNNPIAVAPVIFGIPAPDRPKVLAARDAGATKIVSLPFTGASVVKAVQDAVVDLRPIVQNSAFNGPDRRQRMAPDFKGPDRRRENPHMISPAMRAKILNSIE